MFKNLKSFPTIDEHCLSRNSTDELEFFKYADIKKRMNEIVADSWFRYIDEYFLSEIDGINNAKRDDLKIILQRVYFYAEDSREAACLLSKLQPFILENNPEFEPISAKGTELFSSYVKIFLDQSIPDGCIRLEGGTCTGYKESLHDLRICLDYPPWENLFDQVYNEWLEFTGNPPGQVGLTGPKEPDEWILSIFNAKQNGSNA